MKRMIMFIAMVFCMALSAGAQVDDVTLVVNGEGVTKDEATTKALRSAIEQAFGVFVSANTEILNDELVKDEIATISSGNIKSYTELGIITKDNGNTEVSLQATVSVKKLTTYAINHGSSAEFAGNVFAANLKMTQLNRENTRKALVNLLRQIDAFGTEDLYDCNIEVGNVYADGTVHITLSYYSTEKLALLTDLVFSTLDALSLSSEETQNYDAQGEKYYRYVLDAMGENKNLCYDMKNVKHGNWSDAICFLVPLPDVEICGRDYDIYDNNNNVYDFSCAYYRGVCIRILDGTSSVPGGRSIFIPQKYQKPSLLFKREGSISVPVERLSKITGFTVKQHK